MREKIVCVYKIHSLSHNDRFYIGSAVNVYKRWVEHLRDLRKNRHHSGKLQNHYNKYGANDLVFSILKRCDIRDLLEVEQLFLDIYNPWFNVSPTSRGALGIKRSEETKQKMREIALKRGPLSEEVKEKIKESLRGRVVTEETRRKISKVHLGRKRSKEARRHMKEAQLRSKHRFGRKLSEETKRKIGNANRGKKRSVEFCEKQSKRLRETKKKRPPYSDETRKKMSESMKRTLKAKRERNRIEADK